jgi:hypothetical protein
MQKVLICVALLLINVIHTAVKKDSILQLMNNPTIKHSSDQKKLPLAHAKKVVIAPWSGGFFAGFIVVLNHLGWCKQHNKIPIVHWGKGSLYYQKEEFNGNSTNAWEYYFEPVSNTTYNDNDYKSFKFSLGDPNLHYKILDQYSRNLAYELICQYIKIKPCVQKKIDDFYQQNMAHRRTIGIHLRGTDKITEEKLVTPEKIVAIALAQADPDTQFLISSDEQRLLEIMTSLLKGYDVIYYNCQRSTNGKPLHLKSQHPAQGGEDVLVEVSLLAKCDLLVHSLSNVSTAALYFNPKMEHIGVEA